jgi:hypothetical protein
MQYSKDKAHDVLRLRIKMIDRVRYGRATKEGSPHENVLQSAKIIRSVYLYFNRRLLLSHEILLESLSKEITESLIQMCIYNIARVKAFRLEYNSKFTFNQKRHMKLTLNTLKKYQYLHHFKNIIIAITLRTKLNGQEGVCRLIQTYIN